METDFHPIEDKITTFKDYIKYIKRYGNSIALIDPKTNISISYDELVLKIYEARDSYKKTGSRIVIGIQGLSPIDTIIHVFGVILSGNIAFVIPEKINDYEKTSIQENLHIDLLLTKDGAAPNESSQRVSNNFENIAIIFLTSGTSSEPKFVPLSEKNLLSNLTDITSIYKIKNETLLSILPVYHTFEFMAGLLIPIYYGSKIVCSNYKDTYAIKELINKHKITIMVVVPKVLELLKVRLENKLPGFFKYMPKVVNRYILQFNGICINSFIVGGAQIDLKTKKFFQKLGMNVFVGYGMTECSPIISFSPKNSNLNNYCGEILQSYDYEIIDETLRVSGPSVFNGYIKNNKITKLRNSKIDTGDICRIKNNAFFVEGRKSYSITTSSGLVVTYEYIENYLNKLLGNTYVIINKGDSRILFTTQKNIDIEKINNLITQELGINPNIIDSHYINENDIPYSSIRKIQRGKLIEHEKH